MLPKEFYQEGAAVITRARVLAHGGVIGSLITAPEDDEYSWGRAIAYGAASAADKADGVLSRMHPEGPTVDGGKLDQEWDKATSYGTELVIAIKHKDIAAAASVAVDVVRDRIVKRKRDQLEEAGIDPKSRQLGKIKTVAKGVTNAIALSPLGEKYPRTIRAMRVGCMALSVASGAEFIWSANRSLQENTEET